MRGPIRFISGVLLSFWLTGADAAAVVRPGEYVSSGAWGRLKVEQRDGKTFFSIDSVGANCHLCGLSGRLVGTTAEAVNEVPIEESEVCRIRMTPSRDGREVTVEPLEAEACRQYCGVRASFDGVYRKPQTLCTEKGQQSSRDLFLRQYRAKQFSQAIATLRPLLDQCGEFLDWIEIDRVRNDLSLAYFHAGKAGQCVDTLRKTRAFDFADEDELREELPPCDFENYLSTAQATWHNLRLCGGRTGAQR